MKKETIFLEMVNLEETASDMQHRVNAELDPLWASPYQKHKAFTEQINNYRKYKNYLPNLIAVGESKYSDGLNAIVYKAIENKKVTFECVCFPGPCHLDVVREMVTDLLKEKGFEIVTNADEQKLKDLTTKTPTQEQS